MHRAGFASWSLRAKQSTLARQRPQANTSFNTCTALHKCTSHAVSAFLLSGQEASQLHSQLQTQVSSQVCCCCSSNGELLQTCLTLSASACNHTKCLNNFHTLQVEVVQQVPADSSFESMAAGTKRKYIMISGKGGVGKTSLAASLAVKFAAAGHTTLVVSTDPAHSLSDSLDQVFVC